MTPRGWILFAAISVVWGVPYLFIKLAVDDGLSPGFVAWSRVALAALILLPIALRKGSLRGLPLRWRAACALFEITIPFPLIAFGEQRVSSSLAAILIAAVPLVIAFLIFFRLIAEIGPSRATIITYVNPVVALALGVAILNEQVTTGAVAGLLLILAGSWLSTDGRVPPGLVAVATRVGRRRRPARAPAASPSELRA